MIVAVRRTEKEITEAFTRIKNSAENMELIVNFQKTKYIAAYIPRIQVYKVEIYNEAIEIVEEFCYLGSRVL